jgi:exopolysaccharide production protein ExoZ
VGCFILLVFDLSPLDYGRVTIALFGYYNFGFLFGIGIAFLYGRVGFAAYHRSLVALGGIGILGLSLCFVGECQVGSELFFPSPAAATLIYFLLYSMIILALLSIENKSRPFLDMTLGVLGGASYILYLIHLPLESVLTKLLLLPRLRPLAESAIALPMLVVAAVAISISMYYAIERPMLRWLRLRLESA